MLRAFETEVGHFAFDDARVGAVAAFGQWTPGDVAAESLPQIGQELARSHLEFSNGITQDFQGMHEADAIRVEFMLVGGLLHQGTDCVMGDEQGIEFLDHTDGLEAAQGAAGMDAPLRAVPRMRRPPRPRATVTRPRDSPSRAGRRSA